jgi:hypothetical protein
MRKTLLALVILAAVPAMTMAWPHPGEPAPSIALPDTADVVHTVPSEYAGHVLHLLFWQST